MLTANLQKSFFVFQNFIEKAQNLDVTESEPESSDSGDSHRFVDVPEHVFFVRSFAFKVHSSHFTFMCCHCSSDTLTVQVLTWMVTQVQMVQKL